MLKAINARDIIGLLGVGLVSSGAAWIYPPAGLIVPGFVCLLLAVVWKGGR